MTKTTRSLLALTFMLSLGACGPAPITPHGEPTPEGRQLAEAVCAARETCGCADTRFTSIEQCQAELAAPVNLAIANGVVIDETCFEWVLTSDLLTGCPGGPPPPGSIYVPCMVGNGSKKEGQGCTAYDFAVVSVSDCDDGLRCLGGQCVVTLEPFGPLESGDSCTTDKGCGTFDLYCSPKDLRCHPKASLGEACNDYLGCELHTYCKGLGEANTGICTQRESPGSACGPKDWGACDSPNTEEELYWCNPETSTCTSDSVWLCMWTHPAGG